MTITEEWSKLADNIEAGEDEVDLALAALLLIADKLAEINSTLDWIRTEIAAR